MSLIRWINGVSPALSSCSIGLSGAGVIDLRAGWQVSASQRLSASTQIPCANAIVERPASTGTVVREALYERKSCRNFLDAPTMPKFSSRMARRGRGDAGCLDAVPSGLYEARGS